MAEYERADDCTDNPIPTPDNLFADVSMRCNRTDNDWPLVFVWDFADYMAEETRVVPVFRRATKSECDWVRREMREEQV